VGVDEARGRDGGADRDRHGWDRADRPPTPQLPPELSAISLDAPGLSKRALLERASAAGHAYDPRIVKVEASFAEEIREILVATSDGRMAHDVQPLIRFGVRAIAERDGRRQEGSSGGGGRMTLGYFEGKSPEQHAREAARQAGRCSTRAKRPPVR
jgi:TldD protein